MVKNKTGGNKAKRFARKNVNADSVINRRIRFVTDEDEIYGIVTKVVGNGQAIVMCVDERERLCFIRNKFSGRNKHSNLVTLGSWVIVGLRSWETTKDGKLEKCDLLEIYSNQEKHTLIQECKQNLSVLMKHESLLQNVNDRFEDMITFEDKNNEIENNENDDSYEIESVESIDFDDI